MNKNKLLIRLYLLLVVTFTVQQLPAVAVTCNRLAKRYVISLNTVFTPRTFDLRIFSKIDGTAYNSEITDEAGNLYILNVFKQCNKFTIILPVEVIDDRGFAGNAGGVYQFNYSCMGSVRPNGVISGGCRLMEDPIAGLVEDTGAFKAHPIGNKRFKVKPHNYE